MCWAGMGWYGYVGFAVFDMSCSVLFQIYSTFEWLQPCQCNSSREFKVPSNPCGRRLATCSSCDCFRTKLTILDLPPLSPCCYIVTVPVCFVFSNLHVHLPQRICSDPDLVPFCQRAIPRNEKQLELQKLLQQAKSSGDLTIPNMTRCDAMFASFFGAKPGFNWGLTSMNLEKNADDLLDVRTWTGIGRKP